MTEPQWLDVTTPTVQVRALTWGPAGAPIALCLHGFPDTAYTWRKVAPQLVDAALGYYRAAIRNSRPPAQYAELHRHRLSAPRLPILYLHGTDDGCSEDYTPWIERVLPDESELALVENGGHFLKLDQPDVVARHIVDYVGQAS